MKRVIRLLVLTCMALVALSLIIAFARPETGPTEKAVLIVGVLAISLAAIPARRLN